MSYFGIPIRNGLPVGLGSIIPLLSGGRSAPSLSLNFLSGSLDSRITFTRASTGTYTDSAGVVQSAAIDVPRFDYNPATLSALGFLVEESSQNLCTYSQTFTQAIWLANGSTKTTGISDPAGGVTAATVTATVANGSLQNAAAAVVSGTTYTVSFWMRRRTGTGVVGIRAVENVNTPVTITSTWARYSVTATAVGVLGRVGVYCQTSGDAIDIWGAQLEAKAFRTSYIPTPSTAVVTRAADVATIATLSPWYNAAEGTLFAQFNSVASGTRTVAAINDGTSNESIRLRTVSTDPFFTITDGGVDQANIDAGAVASYTTYKFAGAYAVNDFAACIAGGAAQTDASGTLPTVTQTSLGNSAAANYLNGYLQRITYYPRRLPNAELQALTV